MLAVGLLFSSSLIVPPPVAIVQQAPVAIVQQAAAQQTAARSLIFPSTLIAEESAAAIKIRAAKEAAAAKRAEFGETNPTFNEAPKPAAQIVSQTCDFSEPDEFDDKPKKKLSKACSARLNQMRSQALIDAAEAKKKAAKAAEPPPLIGIPSLPKFF